MLCRAAARRGYVGALDAYAASLPIAAATGETIALVEAWLPAEDVIGARQRHTTRMMLVVAF